MDFFKGVGDAIGKAVDVVTDVNTYEALFDATGKALTGSGTPNEHPTDWFPNWMSNMSNRISLSSLSIPGTHQTMTYEGHGGQFTQCQIWKLDTQLKAGIRFLDIRCRHFNNCLPIHHESFYQHFSFTDVLKMTTAFLSERPKEVIVMRVRKEYNEEGNSRSMSDSVNVALSRFSERFFWRSSNVPTLGEARGKIVLLDDFEGGHRAGINYRSLIIADDWDVKSFSGGPINSKWDGVQRNLEEAEQDADDGQVYLTFCSGASSGAYPNQVAEKINPRLSTFLSRNTGKKRWGMVAMDFPSSNIINKIICSN
ncbi:1-phosphatidylinositol phosphodiesterase-like [Glandiceps talaboti]